ncbi:MAG: enoyl-CoA hydratase, partial [Burkholderiaceae bacterium]|nr:enoyl-CoA hydratase [Burkholderiaceae bacterium]
WCDLRVMESDAYMGVYCRRFGVPLIDGGTVRLPRLIGLGRALDLILTGRKVDATEALAIGLCNRVVAPGQSLEAALELARSLVVFPQRTLRADRASVLAQDGLATAEALLQEWQGGRACLADALRGAARFAQGAGRHGKF